MSGWQPWRQGELIWFRVLMPRELSVRDVGRLVAAVLGDKRLGTVVFEVESRRDGVTYRVGAVDGPRLSTLVEATVPGVSLVETSRRVPQAGQAAELRLSSQRRTLAVDDPEGAALGVLTAIGTKRSTVIHQAVVGRRLQALPVSNEPVFRSETWLGALAEAAVGRGPRVLDAEARRAMRAKQGQLGAEVTIRVLVGESASGKIVGRYEAALKALESPGLRVRLVSSSWQRAQAARPARRACRLNRDEIVSLLAWPVGDRSYPGLDRSGSRKLILVQPERGERVIGITTHPGRLSRIGQTATDGLRHTHVLGPTGVGKSTLLLNLALQDIEAGRGTVVLDPKGDLVDEILARVDQRHVDRLVVLDPARSEAVVGFNPLTGSDTGLAVDHVLHVFHRLYAASWGPRTQDILHSSLLTLADSNLASICHIPRLLVDDRFRRAVLSERPRPAALTMFWSWFDNLSTAERANVIAPLMNKLRPFLLRPALRAMLGQVTPRFDPASVFTERRVLLVPLRKGLIGGEAAGLLGSLVVARIWQLAQERSRIEPRRRHPVFVYMDEFQDYLHLPTDVSDVLATARGLGVGLVLAHQHLGQLTPTVRDAVLANAQSRVCFRLGHDDAGRIARTTELLDAEDFARLGRFHVYASVLDQGVVMPFASATTTAPTPTRRRPDELGDRLARSWGLAPAEVETGLDLTSDPALEPTGGLGRRKRGQS